MITKHVVRSFIGVFTTVALSAFTLSCGDDKKDDKTDESDCDKPNDAVSGGWVTKFSGDSVTVAFPEATAGSEYLVMPYALGNLKSVKGDDDSTVFNFKVESAKGKVLGIQPLRAGQFAIRGFAGSSAVNSMSDLELQHAKRSIMNRFNARKAGGQSEDFWQLVRSVDAADLQRLSPGNSGRAFEDLLRQRERAALLETPKAKKLNLLAAECPPDELVVPALDGDGKGIQAIDITGATVVSTDDFCVVLVDQPTALTADEIKSAMTDMLKVYKTTVYANAFADKQGLTFKPLVAVIDFNNPAKWPAKLKTLYGVFAAEPTEDAGVPMLYMPVTLAGLTDAKVLKNTWLATLAHELQHANMNYFRAGKVEEIPALDEGLAHYFEDFFGYGSIGFKDFAGTYLAKWFNEVPFIKDGEKGDTKDGRGAAQSLWYYLASQKGGVSFTDGKHSGGGGVEFIRAAASSATLSGPEGLATAFGGDWTTTVGNYFGALALDGSSACSVAGRYRTQAIEKDVKDLSGAPAEYGFSFNGYGGMAKSITWDADRQLTALPKVMEDVPYYAPAPFVYKVVDVDAELKISSVAAAEALTATENMAVSVVRIK